MRYFVSFKSYTSLYNSFMEFEDAKYSEVWNQVIREYPLALDQVLSEPEFSRMFGNFTHRQPKIVPFGTECIVYETDEVTGSHTDEVVATYPVHKHVVLKHKTDVSSIVDWFKEAKPKPDIDDVLVQIGCHIEEFGEMLEALGYDPKVIMNWADDFKAKKPAIKHKLEDLKSNTGLLDSLADQMVTATGIATQLGMDIDGALTEVNRSNYSKFEDGKPIFDKNGLSLIHI